jgi:hypothetical protein
MCTSDDLSLEMPRFPLDDATADRLVSGHVHPEDAPPGYARLAAVIREAKAPAVPVVLARHESTIAAMSATIRGNAGIEVPNGAIRRRKSMLARVLTLKAVGITIPALALSAGMAAAATGSLPNPAQSAVSGALSHVGISVPKPADTSGPVTSNSTGGAGASSESIPASGGSPSKSTPVGPSASGPDLYGLCTAYSAQNAQGTATSGSSTSVAFSNLAAAAKAKGETITAYCEGVVPSGGAVTPNGSTSGSSMSGTAGTGHGNAPSNPGPPSSTPASGQANVPTNTGSDSTSGSGATASSSDQGAPSTVRTAPTGSSQTRSHTVR